MATVTLASTAHLVIHLMEHSRRRNAAAYLVPLEHEVYNGSKW
jgi:hypothetical protein